MPKPLNKWLWKAMREWQMSGVAQLHNGQWHRGEPDTFAECGKWMGEGWIGGAAGKEARYPNPWSAKAMRDGQICTTCFAEELALIMPVWESLFGPPKGRVAAPGEQGPG